MLVGLLSGEPAEGDTEMILKCSLCGGTGKVSVRGRAEDDAEERGKAMKTAEEAAEEIVSEVTREIIQPNELARLVAQALTAYTEEHAVAIANATISEACKKARAEALEEAAKMADEIDDEDPYGACCGHEMPIAAKIRALKDKP